MEDNQTAYIEIWNKELATALIPNIVILSIYIATGVIGNGLVIFVYGFRFKDKARENRFFIPFLAVSDMMASGICASAGITFNLMQVTFINDILCKVLRFISALTTFFSCLMLITIAVNRYRKLCKPLGKQLTNRWKKLAIAISLVLSAAVASPMALFYGSVPFPNEDNSLIGLRCSRIKGENKTGSLVYSISIIVLAVAVIVSLVTIYLIIGSKIYDHFKKSEASVIGTMTKMYKGEETKSESDCCSDDKDDNEDKKGAPIGADDMHVNDNYRELGKQSMGDDKTEIKGEIYKVSTLDKKCGKVKDAFSLSTLDRKEMKQNRKGLSNKKNRKIMNRFTLIYMLITGVFLFCFVPKAILLVVEGFDPQIWENLSNSERAGVLFIYRMYIINSVANPIIYGFLDKQFHKELRMCCGCYRR